VKHSKKLKHIRLKKILILLWIVEIFIVSVILAYFTSSITFGEDLVVGKVNIDLMRIYFR